MNTFGLKQQIEFLKNLEEIASNALELEIPVSGWNGADTLKLSKIRKQLEKSLSQGRPRTRPKFESEAERRKFYRELDKQKPSK